MACAVAHDDSSARAKDATDRKLMSDHFDPDGVCSVPYTTLVLSSAYQPLQAPPQVYPDDDGVTRVQLVYNLARYDGPSYSTILRVYNGVAPGPTIHVEQGGRLELELVNCLDFPVGFDGEEAHNRYAHPNSTKYVADKVHSSFCYVSI